MGWISDRKMKTGRGIGGRRAGRAYPKDGAPLRLVVERITVGRSIFESDWVRLECGHETRSWGGLRARCPSCR